MSKSNKAIKGSRLLKEPHRFNPFATKHGDEMIDLRLGDCLEVMKTIPDKSMDAIITDPPFGIGFKYNQHKLDRY